MRCGTLVCNSDAQYTTISWTLVSYTLRHKTPINIDRGTPIKELNRDDSKADNVDAGVLKQLVSVVLSK